jgi:hypothetical protein
MGGRTMNKMVKTCKTQFFVSFSMLEKLIEQCPEEIWGIKAGGFVYWQQLLHALAGTNFWMRLPGEEFSEPFAERKVYPELDKEPEGIVTREEMLEYKDTVKSICESFFEGKEDAYLTKSSCIYDKITNLDLVFMQIRHIQYHVGHCNSILRERSLEAVDWLDYFGE